jgi:hypothetical protein
VKEEALAHWGSVAPKNKKQKQKQKEGRNGHRLGGDFELSAYAVMSY